MGPSWSIWIAAGCQVAEKMSGLPGNDGTCARFTARMVLFGSSYFGSRGLMRTPKQIIALAKMFEPFRESSLRSPFVPSCA